MKRSKIPKLFSLTAMFFLLLTVVTGTGNVYAISSYLTLFNSTYGTSGTVLNTCGVCHINPAGGGTRNPFGNDFANTSIGNHTFNATLNARDSDGDTYSNLTEITARTFPGDATSHPTTTADTTAPTVLSFTIPSTSTSLTVAISSFTASDNVGVTGYLVNESSTKPSAGAKGWRTSAPTSYSAASAGTKTFYAWAKDGAGNVSASRSASVTIALSGGGGSGVTGISGQVKDIATGAVISGALEP